MIFARLCILLQLGLALLWFGSEAARAGIEKPAPSCDQDCIDALTQYAGVYLEERAPALASPAAVFDTAAQSDSKACPARSGNGPAVFGVMLGPGEVEGFTKLQGPVNDIQLMTQVMLDRGVPRDMIYTVSGAGVDRVAMLKTMTMPLGCLRERDQVVLIYSGWGTVYPAEWFDPADFLNAFCQATTDALRASVCEPAYGSAAPREYLMTLRDIIDAMTLQWVHRRQPASNVLPGQRLQVLIGSGSRANDQGSLDRLDGITAIDVSNFVTRVRNIGADAFLIIDTRKAAGGDLVALQQLAAAPPGWAVYGDSMVEYGGMPPVQEEMNARAPLAVFGSGDYAVLYASTPDGNAFEYAQGAESKPLGALIFRVAEALRAGGDIKFKPLSLAIAKSFAARNADVEANGRQEPVFMASNLDLALLAPRGLPKPRAEDEIDIISPSPKRGASEVTEQSFTVVARYTGAAKARMAIIDGELVSVDGNGQFRSDVNDAGSKFSVALRVLGGNYETLALRELKLRERPAEPVIAAPARRLALFIANDTYEDPAFPPLKTPIGDSEALAEILRRRYGFVTELDGGQGRLDLFLRNGTKAQVQEMLFQLRRRLTAEDQLLIFYAGHGESDPDLGAYWVPVDGQQGADFSWIDASEITRELKRMNAGSVLVISDSCYAGGLSRGGQETSSGDGARDRYLAKASRLKARQLMASGGEEPVEDGGGAGHSVFAKALLDALAAMPDQTFTASELFEQKVKPAVIAAANALTEGQTPGFSRIVKAGDEPGAEFMFQAAAAVP